MILASIEDRVFVSLYRLGVMIINRAGVEYHSLRKVSCLLI